MRSNSRSRESSKHSSPKFEPSLYQSQHISPKLLRVLRLFIVLSERVLFSHHQLNEHLERIRFQFTEGCVPCGGYLRRSLSRVPTNHVVLLLDPASSQEAFREIKKWWVYWVVLISSWCSPSPNLLTCTIFGKINRPRPPGSLLHQQKSFFPGYLLKTTRMNCIQ